MIVEGPRPFWATLNPDLDVPQASHNTDPLTSRIQEISDGPRNQTLASWFLSVYRIFLEHQADLQHVALPEGVAKDAVELCARLSSCAIDEVQEAGCLKCLLEERHRAWLTLS